MILGFLLACLYFALSTRTRSWQDFSGKPESSYQAFQTLLDLNSNYSLTSSVCQGHQLHIVQCKKKKKFCHFHLYCSQKHLTEVTKRQSQSQSCSVVSDSVTSWTIHTHVVRGILQARILEWVTFPFSRGTSQPRDEPRSPELQVDSLPVEPQGKPKNTGVGSLSLLQHIFLTQESNWGLLHRRRILYQLSYQGSPLQKWTLQGRQC